MSLSLEIAEFDPFGGAVLCASPLTPDYDTSRDMLSRLHFHLRSDTTSVFMVEAQSSS